MSEPITRGSAMSKHDVDRLVKALEDRGGSITLTDPRVSKATSWIIATAAMVGLGFIGWLATSVNELSIGLRENTVELRNYNRRFDEFRTDYNNDKREILSRISAVEAKK